MFKYLKREGGDPFAPVREYPGGASETFIKGDPVNMESGLLDPGVAADTAIVGICNEDIVLGAGDAGDMVEVILALPDVLFEVDYTAGSKTALADADIGTAFDLAAADPSNIDLDDVTGGAWVVVGYDNDRDVAIVRLLAAKRAAVVG